MWSIHYILIPLILYAPPPSDALSVRSISSCRQNLPIPTRRTAVFLSADNEEFDLNAALTALNAAVEAEDYAEAARLKALIAADASDSDSSASTMTWPTGALPAWLLSRLEHLGFRYPTPVQSAALRSVAPPLGSDDENEARPKSAAAAAVAAAAATAKAWSNHRVPDAGD